MDLDRLKIFYYVAKAGGFSHAARALGISQSAISRQISLLEEQVGKPLFHRGSRNVRLTPAGTSLLETTERFFQEFEATLDIIRDDTAEPQGHLKIGCTTGTALSFLIPQLEKFYARYQQLTLSILVSEAPFNVDAGEVDVMIGHYIHNAPSLVQTALYPVRLALFAGREYLKKHDTPQTAQDLDHHRLIGYGDHLNPFEPLNWFLSLGTHTHRPRKPYLTINTGPGLVEAVVRNLGIATLACEDYVSTPQNSIVRVLPTIDGPTLTNYLIYAQPLSKSRRIQTLEAFLVEETLTL